MKYVLFGVNDIEFAQLQDLVQKQDPLSLWPKMFYFGVLGSKFQKLLSYLKLALLNSSYSSV